MATDGRGILDSGVGRDGARETACAERMAEGVSPRSGVARLRFSAVAEGMLPAEGKLLERFGALDDRSVIYRADDSQQKIHWGRLGASYVIGSIGVALFITVGGMVIGELAAALTLIVILLVFVVLYIPWRRRRNKALTGSSTTWPSP